MAAVAKKEKPEKFLTPHVIRQRLRKNARAMKKLGNELLALIREWESIQSRCNHRWVAYPDPAGGPASYQCEVCGAWK